MLKEYVTEAHSILPIDDRKKVRVRAPLADNQFSLVFHDSAKADSFIEGYRAHGFVCIDPSDESKFEAPLSVTMGRPLLVRRRGAAIRPVYAKLEEILSSMPDLAGSTITQRSLPRAGK